ncbi:C-X-C motif chemokine 6-like [Aquila chrysaetos chrysaetos]|nr:C-X-C motif chemokine 6-like [Aquila chrysaetos chrysaetos]
MRAPAGMGTGPPVLPWRRLLLLLMRYPRLSAPSLPWSSPCAGIARVLRRKGPEETGIPPGRLAQGFSRSQGKRATVFLSILEVNGNLNCRCVKTTSDYISPKRYESIEIRPVGSTCRRMEIIIKLKTPGKVCVNPDAPWVKKLLKRIASTKKK